jgi:hypothetical protein
MHTEAERQKYLQKIEDFKKANTPRTKTVNRLKTTNEVMNEYGQNVFNNLRKLGYSPEESSIGAGQAMASRLGALLQNTATDINIAKGKQASDIRKTENTISNVAKKSTNLVERRALLNRIQRLESEYKKAIDNNEKAKAKLINVQLEKTYTDLGVNEMNTGLLPK